MKRKTLERVKTVAVVCGTVLCAFFVYALWHAPIFESGLSYAVYSSANSSFGFVQTDSPAIAKLTLGETSGESTVYAGDAADELRERFQAEVLFCETACGIVNEYCYSPLLGEGILLNGYTVNLHIARGEGYTAVGTPLIFGGF